MDFLLVINTNLPAIFHRFRDIVFDRSKIAILGYPLVVNPPPDGGFPWDDLLKISPGCQQISSVPNGVETAENFSRLSRVHKRYRQDSKTDRRQTDGRWHIANVNVRYKLIRELVWLYWHCLNGRVLLFTVQNVYVKLAGYFLAILVTVGDRTKQHNDNDNIIMLANQFIHTCIIIQQ